MGGDIEVESRVGDGTGFKISLPINAQKKAAEKTSTVTSDES
jgi:signal transduction histidine kinase